MRLSSLHLAQKSMCRSHIAQKQVVFKDSFLIFIDVYVVVSVYGCGHLWRPEEVVTSWKWSYRRLWTDQCVCWEPGLQSSTGAASALNQWATSPVPCCKSLIQRNVFHSEVWKVLILRFARERPVPQFGVNLKQALIKYWPGLILWRTTPWNFQLSGLETCVTEAFKDKPAWSPYFPMWLCYILRTTTPSISGSYQSLHR